MNEIKNFQLNSLQFIFKNLLFKSILQLFIIELKLEIEELRTGKLNL